MIPFLKSNHRLLISLKKSSFTNHCKYIIHHLNKINDSIIRFLVSLTNITRRYVIKVGITFENVPNIALNLKETNLSRYFSKKSTDLSIFATSLTMRSTRTTKIASNTSRLSVTKTANHLNSFSKLSPYIFSQKPIEDYNLWIRKQW
jgi:hypothetical protein